MNIFDVNNIPRHIFMVLVMLVVMYLVTMLRLSRATAALQKPKPIQRAAVKPSPVGKTEIEAQKLESRAWLMNVKPLPMRAFDFSQGKVDGTLVMYGDKTIRRFVMLWKENGRCKFIRLSTINSDNSEAAITTSIEEAKSVAKAVFGKKQKKETKAEIATPAVASQAVALPPPVVTPAEVCVPTPPVVEKPVIKGFKADWVGVLMAEGSMEHATSRSGEVQTYKAYTVKLNVKDEEVSVQGQDLKRALSEAKAKVGNTIHLIHVRSEPLEGNKYKKVFACSVLR